MMKKSIITITLALCFIIVFNFCGCAERPEGLKPASSVGASDDETNGFTVTDNNGEPETVIKTDNILSPNEVIRKLEKGETVYYDSLNKNNGEIFALFSSDFVAGVQKTFASYEELQKYVFEAEAARASMSRNTSPYMPAYYIEFDNSDFYALALCSDRKIKVGADGSPLLIEGTAIPQTEKDDSIRPEVFAVIEKGGCDIEAKNPASNIKNAGNKPLSLKEAADALNAGQSVRLYDISLPENAELFASALFADPATGEQCKDNNGMIILDEFSAKDFENNADGQVLAAEIYIKYEENGFGKKAVICAYLPAEALEDCVELNAAAMTESSFVNKYSECAAVYKITDYKNARTVFYNESAVNDYLVSFRK